MSDSQHTVDGIERDHASALGQHLGALLQHLGNTKDELLAAVVRQLVSATVAGHACIDLRSNSEFDRENLLRSGVVGRAGEFKPLVVDRDGRLYLHRYWQYERIVAADLRARARMTRLDIHVERLRAILGALFPNEQDALQRLAAAVAALKGLCVLSGGPGTGKTTTVVRVLAVLSQMVGDQVPRMALAAPTGKAAARMQESVRQLRAQLPLPDEVIANIPEQALTLHRLLGSRGMGGGFAYHRQRQLPIDVLVIDEASMLDLAMMARVVEALPEHAKLILVGDRDQLASVDPGAVMGSICAGRNAYTPEFASLLHAVCAAEVPVESKPGVSPLRDAVVLLEHSHRFGGGGIARLARAVRNGRSDDALAVLEAGEDVSWLQSPPEPRLLRELLNEPLRVYANAVRSGNAFDSFVALSAFRVLSATRGGPWGVDALNLLIERQLLREMNVPARQWFVGKAVMITRNHRALQLFNGDVGVTMVTARGLQVVFPGADGRVHALPPARLPAHELAYALTVHKAQGSEFDKILVMLPPPDSPLLSRELLYTAVTRARRHVTLWAGEAALRAAISRPTERGSGLRDACWDQDDEICQM